MTDSDLQYQSFKGYTLIKSWIKEHDTESEVFRLKPQQDPLVEDPLPESDSSPGLRAAVLFLFLFMPFGGIYITTVSK